jgi:uncharacterized membrane protein YccC
MISLSTAGQSLNKGAMRLLGTLAAVTAALIFIPWFAQDRWWFISVLSVYIGFCTYMIAGKKRQYFWYCCAFVCLIICDHAAGNPTNAFNSAVLRVKTKLQKDRKFKDRPQHIECNILKGQT